MLRALSHHFKPSLLVVVGRDALGIVSSVVLVVPAIPETGVWPVVVVLTAVWATMANMLYALAFAEGDYLTGGLGPNGVHPPHGGSPVQSAAISVARRRLG